MRALHQLCLVVSPFCRRRNTLHGFSRRRLANSHEPPGSGPSRRRSRDRLSPAPPAQNVLAAVNPKVFPGYFSVCADGQGFGYGFSYPSLDGHQMSDALLWLGEVETVKLNWDYVRSFQQPNGRLPLAILPPHAGQPIGPSGSQATVDANGGLYEHWVPGNPLAALASPTYIQNADAIYRHTLDRPWLQAQIDSVNLAADYLATLTTAEGVVRGAGYYLERPTRIESDGVAQCHAIDAFRRVAALNRVLGKEETALRYEELANRIRSYFTGQFWKDTHFAEYLHPTRGFISSHGLTDVDWAALATDAALPAQTEILWPQLRTEAAFYYGGMPTGITTRPSSYEDWEFSHPDRHDLAAMGRVWYLEAWARYRHQDSEGLLDGLHRVAAEGQKHGYFWQERYHPSTTDSTAAGRCREVLRVPRKLHSHRPSLPAGYRPPPGRLRGLGPLRDRRILETRLRARLEIAQRDAPVPPASGSSRTGLLRS